MVADHFSAHAADYAKARPSYPPELFAWLAQQCPQRDLAWDCATGNGQAAQALVGHFRHIHATDLSAEQIAQATPDPRIDYRVAPAQASGLADKACDLIAVAQALHWFCNDDFHAEVKRVLKPDGLFAAWTYTLLQSEPPLDLIVGDFYANVVGRWWPPERAWVDRGYRGMPFPCVDIATPEFAIRREWTLPNCWPTSAPGRRRSAASRPPAATRASRWANAWLESGPIRRREGLSSGPSPYAAGG